MASNRSSNRYTGGRQYTQKSTKYRDEGETYTKGKRLPTAGDESGLSANSEKENENIGKLVRKMITDIDNRRYQATKRFADAKKDYDKAKDSEGYEVFKEKMTSAINKYGKALSTLQSSDIIKSWRLYYPGIQKTYKEAEKLAEEGLKLYIADQAKWKKAEASRGHGSERGNQMTGMIGKSYRTVNQRRSSGGRGSRDSKN